MFYIVLCTTEYTLTAGGHSGTAGDSVTNATNPNRVHNGMKFSTRDNNNDNDNGSGYNCAQTLNDAWWFNYCFYSHLNDPYYHSPAVSYANGIIWHHWKGWYYSLKFTEMKTRHNT